MTQHAQQQPSAGPPADGGSVSLGMPSLMGAFDDHHPPDAALIDDCVHCGFCLPTCPTYVLWGEEMDSPRGRIYLMKQGLEGEPMSDSMVQHFDRCLGCMACVTACPSGVQYDRLIESTRAQVERRHDARRQGRGAARAIFALFPYPKRLRLLRGPLRGYQKPGCDRLVRRTGLLERLAPQLAAMEGLAPPPRPAPSRCRRGSRPRGTRRAVVGLLTGCVQGAFFPGVNAATARVLRGRGLRRRRTPPRRGAAARCRVHNGREAEAQAFARRLIDAFDDADVDYVVVNAAGCGSTMKEYADLLADDPRYAERAKAFAAKVRDVSEILAELGPVAPRHPLPMSVAYHDACHLAHAQGVRGQPRQLLTRHPRPGAARDRRGRAVLRLGGHLQHPQPGAGPRAR